MAGATAWRGARDFLGVSLLIHVTLFQQAAVALNNGLGLTPPMGYNAYDHVGCCADEQTLKEQAQAMIDHGLTKLGYQYVNMDCGWIGGRHPNGTLYENPQKFPSGIKGLATWMHARGLKLGLYSDRGTNDFSGKGLGMKGHEDVDAQWMADQGVDYLKVDDMSGEPHTREGAYSDYAKIRDALNKTGRPIFFSTCGHSPNTGADGHSGGPSWMGEACSELANACRIASDVRFWGAGTFGTHKAINIMAEVAGQYSQRGSWPDPDLLFSYQPVGDPTKPPVPCQGPGKLEYCTGSFCDPVQVHSRSQFALWAVMGAPLLLSFDLRNLSKYQLETIANPEVIAVSQDPAGLPGLRVAGSNITGLDPAGETSLTNVWARKLADGSRAVLFLNVGPTAVDVTCDAKCFAKMGWSRPGARDASGWKVRNLWLRKDAPAISAPSLTAKGVPSNGTALFKLTPE